MNLRPYYHMAIVLTITALLGVFSATRLSQRGQWLPEVPSEIGTWTGVDIPLESARVGELGNPQTLGRVYANPFDEKVTAEVIATQTFDAYTEPNMSKSGYGFTLTAQLFPEVFGKGNAARAMVLKHEESGVRVLMLYWVQYEDGTTSGMGSTSGYADMGRRFQTGVGTVASGQASSRDCACVHANATERQQRRTSAAQPVRHRARFV